jgi:hypothetical protein
MQARKIHSGREQHMPSVLSIPATRLAILLVCVLTLLVPCAWTQLYTGSITGVVSDPSAAVVPEAKVILTDVGKDVSQTVTTDATGRYLIRSLPPSDVQADRAVRGI